MHEYLKRIQKAQARGAFGAGEVLDLAVAHDDTCGIYRGDLCDCDPEISFRRGGKRVRIRADGSAEEVSSVSGGRSR